MGGINYEKLTDNFERIPYLAELSRKQLEEIAELLGIATDVDTTMLMLNIDNYYLQNKESERSPIDKAISDVIALKRRVSELEKKVEDLISLRIEERFRDYEVRLKTLDETVWGSSERVYTRGIYRDLPSWAYDIIEKYKNYYSISRHRGWIGFREFGVRIGEPNVVTLVRWHKVWYVVSVHITHGIIIPSRKGKALLLSNSRDVLVELLEKYKGEEAVDEELEQIDYVK